MKKLLVMLSGIFMVIACNNSGESGVVNDGDSAGRAKNRTVNPSADPATDTARGEHRVDIQKRDSQ